MQAVVRRQYQKPALDYHQQVALLKSRGLIIDDIEAAISCLQHISYYRLSAYWLSLEADHQNHQFHTNAHFDYVMRIYNFDHALRLLVLDAIERIEISIRAQWAYHLGHAHGAHAHVDPQLTKSAKMWQSNLDALHKEIERSEEVFVQHFTDCYSEALPPIWACCEVMSLGLLSRWYSNLGVQSVRSKIAAVFDVDHRVLQSWLHHLSVVRNICAHHARLWNRQFGRVAPQVPKTKPNSLRNAFVAHQGLYNTLLIVMHLMEIVVPKNAWRDDLLNLLHTHPDLTSEHMGFPAQWEKLPFWRKL